MQAVRSSRQLSTEVLRMSAWFLSSSIYSSVRGGTETRVRVNPYVCVWLPVTVYETKSAGI